MTLNFNTSINCGSCVKAVTGFLNEIPNIEWSVDTDHPNKILTVKGDHLNAKLIIDTLEEAGFDAEIIKE